MPVKKKLKNILAAVKGTYKEFAAGRTKKNIKMLFAGAVRQKKSEKRVDIYSRGQKRKKALEAAGKH